MPAKDLKGNYRADGVMERCEADKPEMEVLGLFNEAVGRMRNDCALND